MGVGGGLLGASLNADRAAAREAGSGTISIDPSGDIALEPGWLLQWRGDGKADLKQNMHVLINGGRIAAIQDKPLPASIPRLEMGNCLLMPGFISGHNHVACGTPTRGIVETGRSDLRPLLVVEEVLDDDEIDALTQYNLAELILSGCTTQLEMSCTLRQADSYVRAAKAFGARGFPGAMLPNITRLMSIISSDGDAALNASEPETLAEIEQNLAFARKHAGAAEGRIMPMLTPMASDFHTPATMQALADAAKELGTGIHTHLAWHPEENATIKRRWGRTSVQWWEEFGAMDGPFFGAHFGYPDWEVDAPILQRRGAIYAHCPAMSGIGGATQPYPEALGHGIITNVGIDTHSNNYLEVLKLAVVTGQARYHLLKDRSDRPLEEPTMEGAVRGATLHPADALHRRDLGRIEEGAQADLVAVDVSGFQVGAGVLPPEPLNTLFYTSGWSVRHVMTAGVLQVRDGQFQVANAEALMKRGGEVMQKIWAALDAEGWFEAG